MMNVIFTTILYQGYITWFLNHINFFRSIRIIDKELCWSSLSLSISRRNTVSNALCAVRFIEIFQYWLLNLCDLKSKLSFCLPAIFCGYPKTLCWLSVPCNFISQLSLSLDVNSLLARWYLWSMRCVLDHLTI